MSRIPPRPPEASRLAAQAATLPQEGNKNANSRVQKALTALVQNKIPAAATGLGLGGSGYYAFKLFTQNNSVAPVVNPPSDLPPADPAATAAATSGLSAGLSAYVTTFNVSALTLVLSAVGGVAYWVKNQQTKAAAAGSAKASDADGAAGASNPPSSPPLTSSREKGAAASPLSPEDQDELTRLALDGERASPSLDSDKSEAQPSGAPSAPPAAASAGAPPSSDTTGAGTATPPLPLPQPGQSAEGQPVPPASEGEGALPPPKSSASASGDGAPTQNESDPSLSSVLPPQGPSDQSKDASPEAASSQAVPPKADNGASAAPPSSASSSSVAPIATPAKPVLNTSEAAQARVYQQLGQALHAAETSTKAAVAQIKEGSGLQDKTDKQALDTLAEPMQGLMRRETRLHNLSKLIYLVGGVNPEMETLALKFEFDHLAMQELARSSGAVTSVASPNLKDRQEAFAIVHQAYTWMHQQVEDAFSGPNQLHALELFAAFYNRIDLLINVKGVRLSQLISAREAKTKPAATLPQPVSLGEASATLGVSSRRVSMGGRLPIASPGGTLTFKKELQELALRQLTQDLDVASAWVQNRGIEAKKTSDIASAVGVAVTTSDAERVIELFTKFLPAAQAFVEYGLAHQNKSLLKILTESRALSQVDELYSKEAPALVGAFEENLRELQKARMDLDKNKPLQEKQGSRESSRNTASANDADRALTASDFPPLPPDLPPDLPLVSPVPASGLAGSAQAQQLQLPAGSGDAVS